MNMSVHHLECPNIVLSRNSDLVVFAQTSPRAKKKTVIHLTRTSLRGFCTSRDFAAFFYFDLGFVCFEWYLCCIFEARPIVFWPARLSICFCVGFF